MSGRRHDSTECDGGVVVSQPVHQHAYETAVAAQEHGILCRYVTGLYWTGRGITSPEVLGLLSERQRLAVERELRRRSHPELDQGRVHTIARYHIVATAFRRVLGEQAPRVTSHLETWAHERFDAAVASWLRRTRHLDAVHAFEGTALQTFRAAKELGYATILDVPAAHEYFREVIEEEGGDSSVFNTQRIRAERELTDYFLVPSRYAADCLVKHGVSAERIVQIPYGVDPEQFRPQPDRVDSDTFRVLFVGKIGLRKGVRYLLEAWAKLSLGDAELVLVGPTDEAGKALLGRYGAMCRSVGAVPHHEVQRWFSRSDVFVFPSLAEGSALVTYEALASGLPVVTTPNSGSVVDEGCGFVVPERDTDALAKSIKALYDYPELRHRLAASARLTIKRNYTWKHYRKRLASFYRDVPRVDDRVEA